MNDTLDSVTGWSVRWSGGDRGFDRYILARDARRAADVALRHIVGVRTRAERRKRVDAMDVAPARVWRVTHRRGHPPHACDHYIRHGRDADGAYRAVAARIEMYSVNDRSLVIAECDPAHLFEGLPDHALKTLCRGLWPVAFCRRQFGDAFRGGTVTGAMRRSICQALRLAMLIEWPPPPEDADAGARRRAGALEVHGGNVPKATLDACLKAGLLLPGLPLTTPQRNALRALARAYGLPGAGRAPLSHRQLMELWREGWTFVHNYRRPYG